MSAPAFAWALERGASLGLTPAERLVLIYLADMANGARVCWPSQPTIARFTGLALRTVIGTLRRLAEKQLIRADSSPGRLTKYHILRDSTPANGAGDTHAIQTVVAAPTPANGAVPPLQNVHPHPCTSRHEPLHITAPTPANGAGDPSKTQKRDPSARAPAREEGKILSSSNGSGTPPPAPANDATPDCGNEPRLPDPLIAAKLNGLVADIANRFQTNYPPRSSSLTPNEHRDLVAKPPAWHAKPIPPEQLAAMRRIAQIQTVRVDA